MQALCQNFNCGAISTAYGLRATGNFEFASVGVGVCEQVSVYVFNKLAQSIDGGHFKRCRYLPTCDSCIETVSVGDRAESLGEAHEIHYWSTIARIRFW